MYGFTGCVKVAQIRINEIPTEYDYHSHDFNITTNVDFNWVNVFVKDNGLTEEYNQLKGEFKNDTVYHYGSWLTVKETYVHNPRLINVHLEENDTDEERYLSIDISHGRGNFTTEDYILITQLPKPKEESEEESE